MSLWGNNKDEFVTSLAALALYDGDVSITADNISKLLKASNNTVKPYWPTLFAGLLKEGKAETLIFSGGAAPSAAPAAAAAAPAGDAAAAPAAKAEKKKEEVVDALEGGMNMFGGGGGGDY